MWCISLLIHGRFTFSFWIMGLDGKFLNLIENLLYDVNDQQSCSKDPLLFVVRNYPVHSFFSRYLLNILLSAKYSFRHRRQILNLTKQTKTPLLSGVLGPIWPKTNYLKTFQNSWPTYLSLLSIPSNMPAFLPTT